MQPSQFMNFARTLAAVGAKISAACLGNVEIARKSDGSHVTQADTAIQSALCERIRSAFSDHAVICEESGAYLADMPSPSSVRYCWVIDPLDGTRNFCRYLPAYCTSIALLDRGVPVVAVIVDHNRYVFYSAIKGQGAFCGARRLTVAQPEGDKPVVSFQPSSDGETFVRAASWIGDLHLRSFGSTALHLAFVAEGGLDAALCIENRLWDVSAGALLVTEAGGVITDLDGNPIFPFDLTGDVERFTPFIAGKRSVHANLVAQYSFKSP